MRDGRCPKCGLDKVHVSNLTIGPPNRVLLNAVLIAYSAWRGATTAALAQYICVQCGYVEQYVKDAEKLTEIAEKLPRVT